ncbi:MRPL24 [Cordylochernes scorpioides]|uniref:Large ribosomal subunit protein uL24m n=1 Tax=Cordylochernes scorpioides TaxID=51811 RepID=A0ABY6K9K2_9ARAC|nr:MRPL24 [Cordylochernes scorpioides]
MRLTALLQCASKVPKNYHNMPERYVRRVTRKIYYQTPNAINYQKRTIERKNINFGLARPWEVEHNDMNTPDIPYNKIYLEPIKEWNYYRGDWVMVLKGEDKGKIGIVNYIVQERNWILVKGLNTKHIFKNKTRDFPGMLVQEEQPLLINRDVKHVDPSDMKPTKLIWRYNEKGEKVRVSERTGRIIPIPTEAWETMDFKNPNIYKEQPKDTLAKDVEKITFEPKHGTFEQDIMRSMDIEEDRVPRQKY